VNDTKLSSHLMLLKGDIPPDKKDARYVRYLSIGMERGAHAVGVDLGQTLETQQIEELQEELLFNSSIHEKHKIVLYDSRGYRVQHLI
jgi:hypothetical protein